MLYVGTQKLFSYYPIVDNLDHLQFLLLDNTANGTYMFTHACNYLLKIDTKRWIC